MCPARARLSPAASLAYMGIVEKTKAMRTMSALAQPTRLAAFRRLVDALPGGLGAGEIASALGVAPNGMSAHLAILSRAGVVKSRKIGRSIVYTAVTKPVEQLEEFLASARTSDGKAT